MKELESFKDFVLENHFNIYDVAIKTEDREEYLQIRKCNLFNDCFSVTKLMTVTAIGILADRNLLTTDDPIMKYLGSESKGYDRAYDAAWDKVTIKNAMMHSMGIEQGVIDIDRDDTAAYPTDDYLKMIIDNPPTMEPGSKRVYTDVPHYLLSRVVTAVTGMKADEFLQQELLDPLRCRNVAFSRCPKGYTIGSSGAFMRTEDMVKIAWLYMNDGVWEGRRILSEDFVREAEANRYDIYPIENSSFVGKAGMNAQDCIYSREKGIALAFHGSETKDVGTIEQYLVSFF